VLDEGDCLLRILERNFRRMRCGIGFGIERGHEKPNLTGEYDCCESLLEPKVVLSMIGPAKAEPWGRGPPPLAFASPSCGLAEGEANRLEAAVGPRAKGLVKRRVRGASKQSRDWDVIKSRKFGTRDAESFQRCTPTCSLIQQLLSAVSIDH
jgi:hypothetical protein